MRLFLVALTFQTDIATRTTREVITNNLSGLIAAADPEAARGEMVAEGFRRWPDAALAPAQEVSDVTDFVRQFVAAHPT